MPDLGLKLTVAGLITAAALLWGCGNGGSKDELSSGTAGSLRSTLDEVRQRVDVRDCSGATQQAASFRAKVDALPDRVDAKLRSALSSSADRLETLVTSECTAAPAGTTDQPATGATSEGQVQEPQNQDNQGQDGKKDKKPKKEKAPKNDQTQTEPPPDTGGAGEEVPGVGNQGDGASPEG